MIKTYKRVKDPVEFARTLGVDVGERCRLIGITEGTFGSEPYLVSLGSHVTITSGVKFITHDGGVWVFRDESPDLDIIAPIKVGNNVFIGINSIIMPGVTIGDNCVIAAGSVVARDIPSGSVAAGVPSKTIKSVEDYQRGIIPRALNTKGLSRVEKRAFLQELFEEK
ncbi:capsule biosynthesis protein CapG [Geothermobacter hydrogeniphilus]|uniref:Capsule biosynthesis protein CapG n=2 Tax=Geothermobacter hydrogeniphilus TaxID=1969733 RepID=A0A1X0XSP3_9BACT|nr:capsule biosynthesis protein CapG [Geothermobacter hydrogeniphilus]